MRIGVPKEIKPQENRPSWNYGASSFALLKISSFSKISWTANPAATETGIPE